MVLTSRTTPRNRLHRSLPTVIPFHIETLYRHQPTANWALLGATLLAGVAVCSGLLLPDETTAGFALGGGGPAALLTHVLAHDRITPLVVDLLFLWVAGNAVCGIIGNLPFILLYVTLGTVSGVGQLAIGGHPVLGAGGAVSGMIGVCIAYFPTNSVALCYPTPAGLGSRPAPVWALALYWAAWVATAAILHLDATAPWGQLVGMSAGIGLGVVMVLADWVEFTDCDNGPLIVRAQRSRGAAADDRSDEARAELRRLAQQYYEEYAAMPEIKVGGATAPSRRLTLRSSMGFARTAATRAKPTSSDNKPTDTRSTAWPTDLPDVRFFHFDGTKQHGPESRSEFLACLSLSADTSCWWYWAEGMKDWARVEELGRATAKADRSLVGGTTTAA